ncbi:MAG: choice-of-anchor tandem repeat NxxGxxAF-containing protein [Planctomycetota bacterium]
MGKPRGWMGGVAAAVLCGVTAGPAFADGTTTVLTLTGDLLPDGLTSVTPFGPPSLNDSGTVAFVSSPNSGPGAGIVGLMQDSFSGVLTAVGSTGSVPTGSATGLISQFNFPQINSSGLSAFAGTLSGTNSRVLVTGGGGAGLTAAAQEGTVEPTGNGAFGNISGGNQGFALGDGGHLAFTSSLTGVTGGAGTTGLYRVASDGTTVQIAREGLATPSGDGTFDAFIRTGGQEIDGVSVNASGVVAFRAELAGTSLGNGNDTGVYTSDGTTTTKIVRDGDPTGIPDVKFTDVRFVPSFNDAGQAAFEVGLGGSGATASTNEAVYVGNGTTTTQISRKGDTPPEGNGVFFDYIASTVNLNAHGDVAFLADLTGTSGGNSDNRGVYTGDGGALTKVAREGDTAPDGNGVFAGNLGQPVINDDGQVAFSTFLSGTTGGTTDNQALLFYDPTDGLEIVARKGDALAGSTITGLGFATNLFRNTSNAGSGLNNADQVAFRFDLADGRSGIGLWDFEAAVSVLEGDYNSDGFVGFDDLNLVLLNFGATVLPAGFDAAAIPGGLGFDGLMGSNELDGVLLNFGNGTPAIAALPEPGSLLSLLGVAGLTSRRRSK